MKDFCITTNSSIVLEPLSLRLVNKIYKQDWISAVNTNTDKLKSSRNFIKDYLKYSLILLAPKSYCWVVSDKYTKRVFGVILFTVHSNFLTLDFVFKKKVVNNGVAYDSISRAISAVSMYHTLPICSYTDSNNKVVINLLVDSGFDFAYSMNSVNYYVKRGR